MPGLRSLRSRALLLSALTALAALAAATPAQAVVEPGATGPQPAYVPGEVLVTGDDGVTRARQIPAGESVEEAVERLERRRGVRHAAPNMLARTSAFVPNDPGRDAVPGAWQNTQWNFLPGAGVNAPGAWDNLIAAGRPGGNGVVVAVLDTGVAYRDMGRFKRSPDLNPRRFRRGYDFVDNDRFPLDHNGHGTHVASTIAEAAHNGIGLVGLAYGATIMPVRVLDRDGYGESLWIANGIRHAARNGASIINLSFEFPTRVSADQIPDILAAVRYAHSRGVLVVGSSGNESGRTVAYPARVSAVLSVGATTEHACQAEYSNDGPGLDIVAPGGGDDADIPEEPNCRPEDSLRDIYQMTFTTSSVRRFGYPGGFTGTSMAAPHVSAAAALVIASGVLGPKPTPDAIKDRLQQTVRDLGPPGPDQRYGAGLLDAAAATAPAAPAPV